VRRQVGAEGRGVLRAVGVGIGDGGREVRRPSKEGASALASRGGGAAPGSMVGAWGLQFFVVFMGGTGLGEPSDKCIQHS
jgi:hypothetical protein